MNDDTFYYQAVRSTYKDEVMVELYEAILTEGRLILGTPVMLSARSKQELQEKLLKMYVDLKKYDTIVEDLSRNIEKEDYEGDDVEYIPDLMDMFNNE